MNGPTRVGRYDLPLARIATEDHLPRVIEQFADRPASVMARGRVLKHDATTTVTLVRGDGCGWVIKRYNTKNLWHALRRQLRTSRALNCWRAAAWLRDAGIDTPRPVAVLEERYWRVLRGRSYLICKFIDGETLDKVLGRQALEGHVGDNDALIEQAAGIIRRLREHDIVHGDLKATNLVVQGGRVFLLDLDAARRASGRRLAAGLHKDLRRFLRNWDDQPTLAQAFRQRLST